MLKVRNQLYNFSIRTAINDDAFLVENMIIKGILVIGKISKGVKWTRYTGQEIVNKQKSGRGRQLGTARTPRFTGTG